MSRAEFTAKMKERAYERSKGFCENNRCGIRLTDGRIHYDHILPDWLGGDNSLSNCHVLCVACHRTKTATEDQPRIAKTKRQHRRAIGIRKKTSFKGWRGFDGRPIRNPNTG